MFISYFDDSRLTEKALKTNLKKLAKYRAEVSAVGETNDTTRPEYSLFHAKEYALHETLEVVKKDFKNVKHVILIGIGIIRLACIHQIFQSQYRTLSYRISQIIK